ncbi:MAG: Cysteine desulfurase IscS [candidate division WS2 bacterium]|uniref:cysteine desulfurase n=1 Tax=Psychracetigena formicireducens TaxID=2986056 RepID=A0A9E2BFZ6_PSYF1|nr:Cysteine desulfurase IscS [Candidatus Psychracetigena formicireducens]
MKIYFDNIATTKIHPEVYKFMLPCLGENYGNPESLHFFGDESKSTIESSRSNIAQLINSKPEEIIFTSSGTEANNLAVKGVAEACLSIGKHLITSSIEHFSVHHPFKRLEKLGYEVTYLPVDRCGLVNPDDVRKSLRKDTILVSVMHANNEIGSIQPIEEISRVVKENSKAYFHTDAVQSVGYLDVDINKMGVDLLSISAHKFYGPKGVGALYVRKGTRMLPLIEGGVQENGRRAGTHNVPGIAGMGKAVEILKEKREEWATHLISLRDALVKGITNLVEKVHFTGHPQKRLPGHVSLCVEFIEGESMLMLLSAKGIAAASGSTCTSKALRASHVLTALALPAEIIQGSLVLSLSPDNHSSEIEYFLKVFPEIVSRLRNMSPLYTKYLKEKGV